MFIKVTFISYRLMWKILLAIELHMTFLFEVHFSRPWIHGLKIDASEFFTKGQMVIETMSDFEHVFLLIPPY